MSTLKFRAWIEPQKYMAIQGSPDLETLESFMHHYAKEKNIMLFTGLPDINGQDVFQGDIVLYSLTHDSSKKEHTAQIEWHKHAWRLNRIWLLTEIRSIKVIGNIFEHPELLKK